jgi:hypothetical protein
MRGLPVRLALLITLALPLYSIAAQAPTSAPTTEKYQTFGVSHTPPAGWVHAPEKDATVMAAWEFPGAKEASLTVNVAPLERRSVRNMAEAAAAGVDGKVDETILGERTVMRITAGRQGAAALFAQRNGYLYQVLYTPPPNDPGAATLESLRRSWKWIDVEPPAKFPQPVSAPRVLYDRMSVAVPAVMRPFQDPRVNAIVFAAADFTSARFRVDFRVEITIPPEFANRPLQELTNEMGEQMRHQYHILEQIEWTKPAADRVISPNIVDNAQKMHGRLTMRKALIELPGGQRAYLNFINTAPVTKDRQGYDVMAEEITASIRAAAAPATTTSPVTTPTIPPIAE